MQIAYVDESSFTLSDTGETLNKLIILHGHSLVFHLCNRTKFSTVLILAGLIGRAISIVNQNVSH